MADWLFFSCVENFAHPGGWALQPNPNDCYAALSVFFYAPKPQASLDFADWLFFSCVENFAHPEGGALQPNPNGCCTALWSFFMSQSRKQAWDWRIGSFSPASKISPILKGGRFNPIPMTATQPFGLFLCPKASNKFGLWDIKKSRASFEAPGLC